MTSVKSDREICPKATSQKGVDHVGAVLTDRHLYYKAYFAICTLKFWPLGILVSLYYKKAQDCSCAILSVDRVED